MGTAIQLQGKELSYNNLNDTDAAFELVAEFDEPAVAIIKHANPCGVAIGTNLMELIKKQYNAIKQARLAESSLSMRNLPEKWRPKYWKYLQK